MGNVADAIHNHHQEILANMDKYVSALLEGDQKVDAKGFVNFLKADLLPHAAGEESSLYPAVDPLVKNYGRPTATMTVDHEFVKGYVEQIEKATAALATASEADRPAREEALARLGLQLQAVLTLHLAKEERVYIPLFEEYIPEQDQQRILDGMHEAYEEQPAQAAGRAEYLDVRNVPPPRRHVLIFDTFQALKPREAFVLVNDHDPKPLYYQFQAELAGQYTWDYLESGPEVWQVRIGRA